MLFHDTASDVRSEQPLFTLSLNLDEEVLIILNMPDWNLVEKKYCLLTVHAAFYGWPWRPSSRPLLFPLWISPHLASSYRCTTLYMCFMHFTVQNSSQQLAMEFTVDKFCLCDEAICLLLWLISALLLQWLVHECVCGFMFACTYLNCQINLVYSKSCLMKCSVCKDQLELGVPSAWVLIASQLSLVMMPSTLSRHEATDDTANIHTLKHTLTTAYSVFKTWIYLM